MGDKNEQLHFEEVNATEYYNLFKFLTEVSKLWLEQQLKEIRPMINARNKGKLKFDLN